MGKIKLISAFGGLLVLLLSYGNNRISIVDEWFVHANKYESKISKETVKIGNQEWMIDNLNVNKFKNGELIPKAESNKEWIDAYKEGKPAWCYFENDPENGKKYGKLYNWYAVNDTIRGGIAPEGWHIPSNEEWRQLTNYLVGHTSAAQKLKSISGWKMEGNGNNQSGFTGFPGGLRLPNGKFDSAGLYSYWWSSSEYLSANAWSRILYHNDSIITTNHHKANGFSVRLLKD